MSDIHIKPAAAAAEIGRVAHQIELIRTALAKTSPVMLPRGIPNEAAILVPMVEREGELNLVFIRRSDHVESHRGQVAFPGGRVDRVDETLMHTALREAHEEVGIDPKSVDVLGGLPEMRTTATGMSVASFVGVLRTPPDYRIDPVEVAQVFEVPLGALSDVRYRGFHEWRRATDQTVSKFPAILYGGQTIWGLTLRITETLLEILGAPRPPGGRT